MDVVEEALVFACADEQLPGIIAWPQPLHQATRGTGAAHADAGVRPCLCGDGSLPRADSEALGNSREPGRSGVLVVVGGPQYRVGSHRQFLLLSRRLASAGYAVMRFDYRGMGDAGGAMRSFEEVSDDIAAAIDAFQRACPAVRRIVLWGLCDAASAALLYVERTNDPRVAGLVLLNPWVRSEASLAQTQVKHYYGQRLLQRAFWAKLFAARVDLRRSLRELWQTLGVALRRRPASQPDSRSFQDRMADGWRRFRGGLLLILSGHDYTAREFIEYTTTSASWAGLLGEARLTRIDLAEADHTFSSADQRQAVEEATLEWLTQQEESLS